MASGGLVPQSNFAQTGTVDWVQMGDSAVTLTLKTLARIANHGVDAHTLFLGLAIGRLFPLGAKGEKRISGAIGALSRRPSFNSAMFFGFGWESIPQVLGANNEGLTLLALSAALSEVYHVRVAAMVLNEILLDQNLPRETTPSLQSWWKLAKACAGTIATTKFGKRAEELMSKHSGQKSLVPGEQPEEVDDSMRSRSSAKDIAKALILLGSVTRGELECVTILGGGDIGFLATVACWLFDMNIVIKNDKGEVCYQNSLDGAAVQAVFKFENKDRFDIANERASGRDLQLFDYPQKVFRLQNVLDVVHMNDQNEQLQASGRLDWSTCLSDTFGALFGKLQTLHSTCGTAIGCAARIFYAVASADGEVDIETRRNWIYYASFGSGQAYIGNLLYWFPELQAFRTRIEEAVDLDFIDAKNHYESAIAMLASNCECMYCTIHSKQQRPKRFCLVVVLEMILRAGLMLSNVSVEKGLRPKRAGFERLHDRQAAYRSQAKAPRLDMERKYGSSMLWVIEPERSSVLPEYYSVQHKMRRLMDDALGLFTFLDEEIVSSQICAFASNGICAYRTILTGLDGKDGPASAFGGIHIVPGRIESNGIAFDWVEDWFENSSAEFTDELTEYIVPEELEFRNLSMHMEQLPDKLGVVYRLSNTNQNIIKIPPTVLATAGLEAYRVLSCDHPHHTQCHAQAEDINARFSVHKVYQKEISLYRAPDKQSLCAVLIIADVYSRKYSILWDDLCMRCSVNRGFGQIQGSKPLLIIQTRGNSSWN